MRHCRQREGGAVPASSRARAVLLSAALAACAGSDTAASADTESDPAVLSAPETLAAVDTAATPSRASSVLSRRSAMSPLADSIARYLVFITRGDGPYTAAARDRRLLLDLGRVDTRVKSPERRRAYKEAVTTLSPVRVGDRVRLRGKWGADDATVTGFDEVQGRIVATLDAPRAVDSLAKRKEPLVAAAVRTDSVATAVRDTCPRDSLSPGLRAHVRSLRDSFAAPLWADTTGLSERLKKSVKVQASHVAGCFGGARALLVVALRAGDYEYVREIAVLVDDGGKATPLKVNDLRFRAHALLHALDADGDGVDDVATRGRTERAGGTSVLRVNTKARRLEWLTSGFAWETY
jgi:hypothetical protein